jgi:hypothetical protein
MGCYLLSRIMRQASATGEAVKSAAELVVIPGRASARTRNLARHYLEIPGSMLRIAPE